MDKVPTMCPLGTMQEHSEFSKLIYSQFSQYRKCSVHFECSRSGDHDVPIRKFLGTFWMFPKNVLMMFWKRSFKVFLTVPWIVWLQCSDLENSKCTEPMNWKCSQVAHSGCPIKLSKMYHNQWIFVKPVENRKYMLGKLENWEHFECTYDFPQVSQKFTNCGTSWTIWWDILNEPLGVEQRRVYSTYYNGTLTLPGRGEGRGLLGCCCEGW